MPCRQPLCIPALMTVPSRVGTCEPARRRRHSTSGRRTAPGCAAYRWHAAWPSRSCWVLAMQCQPQDCLRPQSSPLVPHQLCTGSYDERVRLFDTRNMICPVMTAEVSTSTARCAPAWCLSTVERMCSVRNRATPHAGRHGRRGVACEMAPSRPSASPGRLHAERLRKCG